MTISGVITRMAATMAAPVATKFMARRYALTRSRTNSPLSDIGPRRHAARRHPHQPARDHVDDQGDQEKRQPDLDDGAEVEIRSGFAEFVGNDGRHARSGRE